MALQQKNSCAPFSTQVYRVHFCRRQEKGNSKVFAPKRPRNADISATLVFSTAVYNRLLAAISFGAKRDLYEVAQFCTNRCRTPASPKRGSILSQASVDRNSDFCSDTPNTN